LTAPTGPSRKEEVFGSDPAQVVASVVARLDPTVDRAELAALLCAMVPYPRWRQKIADQLTSRPELLTGAGAHGSANVVTLIEALRERGVAGVVIPACPFCDRLVRLPRSRDGLRCCKRCWNQAHAKLCARCGELAVMTRRTGDGQSLCAACCRTEPSLAETCTSCGRKALPARRDGEIVQCQNCCTPPVATCSVCGRRKPCALAGTDTPRCKNCTDRLRVEPCSACGRRSTVNRRTSSGKPLCKSCGSMDSCTGCRRRRPIRVRTEHGIFCQSCYRNDTSSHRACTRCGSIERLHHFGLCTTCAWPEVVRWLLIGPDGTVPPAIEPVLAALAATDAAAGLNWVARVRTQQTLAELAIGAGPVTHQFLDGLAPNGAVTHLRAILIQAGVLPARDERLIRLDSAVERRIARVKEPAARKILRSFATWHHLRRLRTLAVREPLTQDQVVYAMNSLTAAASLLNWLHGRGQNLATCTQTDIDDWLTVDPFSRSRGFVSWAVKRGHAHGIEVPPFNNESVREVFAEHDQRWLLARRLLSDSSIAVADRVAGLLVLLYAQRAVRITRLTTEHILVTQAGVQLLLGEQPIAVPSALGELLMELLHDRRDATATGPDDRTWLYPARRLGQPLAPRDLLRRLRVLDVSPTLGRNTALMEMASEMPAAVITRLLGISLNRATRWTQDAGNTRPGYAAELARRRAAQSSPQQG
jgi:hypothetical protein